MNGVATTIIGIITIILSLLIDLIVDKNQKQPNEFITMRLIKLVSTIYGVVIILMSCGNEQCQRRIVKICTNIYVGLISCVLITTYFDLTPIEFIEFISKLTKEKDYALIKSTISSTNQISISLKLFVTILWIFSLVLEYFLYHSKYYKDEVKIKKEKLYSPPNLNQNNEVIIIE